MSVSHSIVKLTQWSLILRYFLEFLENSTVWTLSSAAIWHDLIFIRDAFATQNRDIEDGIVRCARIIISFTCNVIVLQFVAQIDRCKRLDIIIQMCMTIVIINNIFPLWQPKGEIMKELFFVCLLCLFSDCPHICHCSKSIFHSKEVCALAL